MPKHWEKQIFSLGSFLKWVKSKRRKRKEKKRKKERAKAKANYQFIISIVTLKLFPTSFKHQRIFYGVSDDVLAL